MNWFDLVAKMWNCTLINCPTVDNFLSSHFYQTDSWSITIIFFLHYTNEWFAELEVRRFNCGSRYCAEAPGDIRHGESVILIFICRWADFWKRTGTNAAWRFLLLSLQLACHILNSKVTSAWQTTAVKKGNFSRISSAWFHCCLK